MARPPAIIGQLERKIAGKKDGLIAALEIAEGFRSQIERLETKLHAARIAAQEDRE